jgi:glycosyltransferase involved in cell wall biosynthesis
LKILYLGPDLGIPVLGRKGASVHVRELVRALSRAGHSVVLASPLLSKSPWEPPAELEVPIIQLPLAPPAYEAVLAVKSFEESVDASSSLPGELRRILWNQQAAVELKRRFEHHRPDVIYERASLYATVGALLAEVLDVPLLVELNAPIAEEQATYRASGLGELAAHAERWALTRADAVLAVSEPLREYAAGLGVGAGRIHVVVNGVDPARFHPGASDPEVTARWGIDADGAVLGFTGGLRPWHGVAALPELLERLSEGHGDVRLVVAGDGPLRAELERELRRRGLEDRAVLTGSLSHDEIPALVRRFDVALAPYERLEHPFYFSPLKLFEYMACAKPVVVAGVGQLPEIVEHGKTGLVYPPGDLDALTSACDRLLSDPALRRRQGDEAARLVRERYTWDHNAARVTELARSMLASPAERG